MGESESFKVNLVHPDDRAFGLVAEGNQHGFWSLGAGENRERRRGFARGPVDQGVVSA